MTNKKSKINPEDRSQSIRKVSDHLAANVYHNYACYHIPELGHQKIKRKDIAPYIDDLKHNQRFEVSKAGESVEGREINLIKLGNGPRKVFLWSQMHGDEATATRALFEVFRFFATEDALNSFKDEILKNTTILCIPMLNPDGAEVFKRQNALDIDLNRDALRLISPESKILKGVRDKFDPEFGFNLHDQSKYYNVSGSGKTAAISFLAPPASAEKEIGEGRAKAMKLIGSMNKVLQQCIPGQVAKYKDDFEARAFGDNIQKWGTSTVLIESGGMPGDPEKKELVKMNFIAILHALEQIANGNYQEVSLDEYFAIPENDKKFFDLLIRNGEVMKSGKTFLADIGILIEENEGVEESKIEEIGDLSTHYGYEEVDASGMIISVKPQLNSVEISLGIKADIQIVKDGKNIFTIANGRIVH